MKQWGDNVETVIGICGIWVGVFLLIVYLGPEWTIAEFYKPVILSWLITGWFLVGLTMIFKGRENK